jgi:hypothetical protein
MKKVAFPHSLEIGMRVRGRFLKTAEVQRAGAAGRHRIQGGVHAPRGSDDRRRDRKRSTVRAAHARQLSSAEPAEFSTGAKSTSTRRPPSGESSS